jgi:uncharacterized protein
MKSVMCLCVAVAVLCLVSPVSWGEEAGSSAKTIRAGVLTGGHSYDKKAFPALFKGHENIEFTFEEQKDHSELFEDISDWQYDVIVVYAMTQQISEKRRKNLLALMDRGVGVVILHHTIAAFDGWDEFRKIVGSKYLQAAVELDGAKRAKSSFQHDVDMKITVADREHPVTAGVKDFTVHDETYKDCFFEADNHVLLTTDHPTSDKVIGWTRTYRKARVCTVQMGHGPSIFADENYRRLVAQATRWVGKGK